MPASARPEPKRRRWTWLAGAVLVTAMAVHSGIWWVTAGRIEQGVPAFAAAAAQSGWRFESGEPTRSGWPGKATIRLPAFSATRVLGGATLRWTAERLDVSIGPLRPSELELAPVGLQTITLTGGAEILPFRAAQMLARVPLSDGPIGLLAEGLVLGTASTGVRAATLTGSIEPQRLAFLAGGIAILPALAAPFDGPLDLSLGLATNTAFLAAATPSQSAAAWRDAGGRAELTTLAVRWGKLLVEGAGTAGLDAQLQPEGRASLRVQGAVEALDAMAQGGMVAPGPASAARAVLGLLVLAAHGGPVTLPVAVRDRVLTVTQFPVIRLPSLDWNLP